MDKALARVHVFHADGRLHGATPALLGLAVGDDSVPGIGDRPLASILPHERTTPAGRFVANLDRNLQGKETLWVDYDTAVSLHPVVTGSATERRAERLASASPLDNRISYGCINVSANFFRTVVMVAFKNSNGIAYVLPETRSPQTVFGSFDVDDAAHVARSALIDGNEIRWPESASTDYRSSRSHGALCRRVRDQLISQLAADACRRQLPWLTPLRKCERVVWPLAGPQAALPYLSRYTHRVPPRTLQITCSDNGFPALDGSVARLAARGTATVRAGCRRQSCMTCPMDDRSRAAAS
ncbi:hypothetical protein PEC18_36720 [Paucibacter sp. O1-1]|nr:hypothetical protein [Paucibacter sp. O1-1]MDA3831197.1 hypothetical protein [Paucibacter sp. O1-1]